MEQSPLEADKFPAGQEIPNILKTLKFFLPHSQEPKKSTVVVNVS